MTYSVGEHDISIIFFCPTDETLPSVQQSWRRGDRGHSVPFITVQSKVFTKEGHFSKRKKIEFFLPTFDIIHLFKTYQSIQYGIMITTTVYSLKLKE